MSEREPVKHSRELFKATWKNGATWEFFTVSPLELPPASELCTAAFCVVTYKNRVIVIQHSDRGYEFPGGHIEANESSEDTVRREVREETGAIIRDVTYFGAKVVTSPQPIPDRDHPGQFYPFPHAYVPYYFAEATEVLPLSLTPDVKSISLVSKKEALEVLAGDQHHDKILQHLIEHRGLAVL